MLSYIRKYRLFLIIGSLLVIGIVYVNRDTPGGLEVEEMEASASDLNPVEKQEETTETPEIAVDIKGAVLDQGVYNLNENARIYDVIELAGGFLKEADVKQINLAQRVHDEMLIYVPYKGEENVPITVTNNNSSAVGNQTDAIRINIATIEELQTLNGVGPSKAQAILDYIEENGPLTDADDLLQISGIGEKTLEKFKDNIIIP